jgi:Fuc2NAc and GlcNAc transferase
MGMTAPIVFLLAAILTWGIRTAARRYALLDVPNARSSHTVPTPKGGGLALVAAFLCGLVWLRFTGKIEADLFWALLSALPIAAVGFIDDIKPLSARLRLGIQIVSAVSALIAVGGVSALNLGPLRIEGAWINVFAFFFILWMTNLYNFLDGIDGYAGSEAVFAGAAGYLLFGSEAGMVIAAASAGFLLFNWHKASIFMGDVGSATLGFLFAVLTIYDAASPSFMGWIVLLSLFWFDATVTLWRRWRHGERLSQAHRKHAYQRLHQSGMTHDKVVIRGMGLNTLLFAMLWTVEPYAYWVVFLAAVALLWSAMRYVDRQKAFS